MVRLATSVLALAVLATSVVAQESYEQYGRSLSENELDTRAIDDYIFVRDTLEQEFGRDLTDLETREILEQLEEREPLGFGFAAKLLSKGIKAGIHHGHHHGSGSNNQQNNRRSFDEEEELFTREFDDELEGRDLKEYLEAREPGLISFIRGKIQKKTKPAAAADDDDMDEFSAREVMEDLEARNIIDWFKNLFSGKKPAATPAATPSATSSAAPAATSAAAPAADASAAAPADDAPAADAAAAPAAEPAADAAAAPEGRSFDDMDAFEAREFYDDLEAREPGLGRWIKKKFGSKQQPQQSQADQQFQERAFDDMMDEFEAREFFDDMEAREPGLGRWFKKKFGSKQQPQAAPQSQDQQMQERSFDDMEYLMQREFVDYYDELD